MDCIVGYHLNPLSCGIAKFNQALAEELAVPHLSLFDPSVARMSRPLLSIKISEFTKAHARDLERFLDDRPATQSLRLFLHAYDDTPIEHKLIAESDIVYVGNVELANRLKPICPDVVESWCPGVLFDVDDFTPTDISVFTFGMAHKVRGDNYRALEALLNKTGKSHSLYLSTALHEGTAIESAFTGAVKGIRSNYDGPVHFLGFISDTAVNHYLQTTTFFAAFFPKGVRANNTSLHTALSAGAVVITNLDENSPPVYKHMETVLDINQLEDLPTDPNVLARIAEAGKVAAESFSWGKLVDQLLEADNRIPAARMKV
ncbi:MAG: hypothetical protein K9H25_01370 [Rhodospirillum sp.]|nr:hypothetical protein [Rhodospirillum sp.]MCF8488095.1 hypothetical protein [Rhodospirillum sp.]MCF8501579.1 hypothetical protein [Rhodospirillum sp.]